MKYLLLTILLISTICYSQKQVEIPFQKPCPYGYLEYIPECEKVEENCQVIIKCPKALLINLIGFGERGNGTTELYKASNAGVSRLIRDGQWNRNEFIVITPQLFTGQNMYSPKTLNVFIEQMKDKYPIDTTEIYLVGLSGGANSIYPYIGTYKGIRGAVAIAGYGASRLGPLANTNGTKIWEFHGETDNVVPYSMSFHKAYVMSEKIETNNAKFTGFPNVGHYGWQEVYSGKWLNKYSVNDPFDEDVFNWLLK